MMHRPNDSFLQSRGHVLACLWLACLLAASAAIAHAQGTVPSPGTAAASGLKTRAEPPDASSRIPLAEACRPADEAAPAKPFPLPDVGRVPLLPLGRLMIVIGDEHPQAWAFPTGPHSHSFVAEVRDPQGARHDAVAVSCFRSWTVVTKPVPCAFIEFPLQLPKQSPVQLRAVMHSSKPSKRAKKAPAVKPAQWRVWVRPFENAAAERGYLLFFWESGQPAWQETIVDLSDFAGEAIWLQLQVVANGARARLYWVEPTLICGTP